jgi:hypothetical protein
MFRRYLIAAAALIALTAVSCSKNETDENTSPENAVGFGVYTLVSKADGGYFVDGTTHSNIPNGKSIGVFGYVLNGTNWATSGASTNPNMFNDVMVTATADNGSAFTYSPTRYWPSSTSYKLSFYAYYPYGSGMGITPTVTTGMGSYAFTTKDDPAQQVDFMVSDLAVDKSKAAGNPADGNVVLNFHHMLCQVKATVSLASEVLNNPGYKGYSITSLTITNVKKSGTLTPSYNTTTNATEYSWATSGTSGNYTITTGTNQDKVLLLIPQALQAGAQIIVKYTLTFNYSSDKTDTSKDVTYEGTLITDDLNSGTVTSWERNKIYNYTITLTMNKILFSTDVTNWVVGSSASI